MRSRMYEGLKTWNPWFGCKHNCYNGGCWANKRLAHRMGRGIKCLLCYDFEPHLHPGRLRRIPKDPKIFVVAHGDLFGAWVPSEIIRRILQVCKENHREVWFFETKNPQRYLTFITDFPPNTVLSATIETNRTYPVEIRGYTEYPLQRFYCMLEVVGYKIPVHVSIEPILDFDLEELLSWMKKLNPFKVSVGYDSLHNNLPEPPKEKTLSLIEELEKFTEVERKQL